MCALWTGSRTNNSGRKSTITAHRHNARLHTAHSSHTHVKRPVLHLVRETWVWTLALLHCGIILLMHGLLFGECKFARNAFKYSTRFVERRRDNFIQAALHGQRHCCTRRTRKCWETTSKNPQATLQLAQSETLKCSLVKFFVRPTNDARRVPLPFALTFRPTKVNECGECGGIMRNVNAGTNISNAPPRNVIKHVSHKTQSSNTSAETQSHGGKPLARKSATVWQRKIAHFQPKRKNELSVQ